MQFIGTKQVREMFNGISSVTLCKYRKLGIVPEPVINTTHPQWHKKDVERAQAIYKAKQRGKANGAA